jgi:hypothetical protein
LFDSYRRLDFAARAACFEAPCATADGHAAREPGWNWGLWGGVAGSFAGFALFAVASLNVGGGNTPGPVAVENLGAGLKDAQPIVLTIQGRQDSVEDLLGEDLLPEGPSRLPFLGELVAGNAEPPPPFPASPVHLRQFHMVELLDEPANAPPGIVGVPVVFRPPTQ